jgi:hypothetical protein
VQLRTVEELLKGKGIDAPPSNVTFKKAPKAATGAKQISLVPPDESDPSA